MATPLAIAVVSACKMQPSENYSLHAVPWAGHERLTTRPAPPRPPRLPWSVGHGGTSAINFRAFGNYIEMRKVAAYAILGTNARRSTQQQR
jgi:hypothetical protein